MQKQLFKVRAQAGSDKNKFKNGSGEGTKVQCDFSLILVHFGCPFGVDFDPKTFPKTKSKTECKNESLKFGLGELDPLQDSPGLTPSRL